MITTLYRCIPRILPVFFFIILVSAQLRAQTMPWELVGPYIGTTASFATGDGLLVAMPDEGLFTSEDVGDHWSRVPYHFNRQDIQFVVARGSMIFAFGKGLERSTDRGLTWDHLYTPLPYSAACFIGDTIYAISTYGNIYRSDDNGVQWSHVASLPEKEGRMLRSDGPTLYYEGGRGLFRSRDGGRTWSSLWKNPTANSIRTFASHDSLLILSLPLGTQPDLLYRSTDDGTTWAVVPRSGIPMYFYSIVWDRDEFFASCVYQGGVFRSRDGLNWSRIPSSPFSELKTIHVAGDTMLVASYGWQMEGGAHGGIFRSLDRGETWQRINNGYVNEPVRSIASLDNDLYVSVRNSGLFKSTDNGTRWSFVSSTISYHDVRCVTASPTAVVIGMSSSGLSGSGGIYRSVDRGASWVRTDPGLGSVSRLTASGNLIVAVARTPGGEEGIYFSDSGDNWQRSATAAEIPSGIMYDIRFVGNALITGTSSGIFRSMDTGRTWTNISNGIKPTTSISAIGSGNNDVLLAGTAGGQDGSIFRSVNNGVSWTPAHPSQGISEVTGFTSSGNRIFASTKGAGILRSTNNGETWRPFNNGSFETSATGIQIHNGSLFASVESGGILRNALLLAVERDQPHTPSTSPTLYPNPCRNSATIRYHIPEGPEMNPRVNIILYDARGREALRAVDGGRDAGIHNEEIDLTGLASGIYFYALRIDNEQQWGSFVVFGD